jgi:23S rRNA-/tRNA-specific pseudouridylate synthase
MHQLRVHCAGMGHPLVADPLYGRPGLPGERLHLHARSVGLADRHGQRIDVLAAAPRQMVPALTACGFAPGDSVAPAG